MKTRSQIQLNYRQAMNQADRLDAIAANVERIAGQDMESSMRKLSNGWKGENASAFLMKESVLQGEISRTAKNIRSIATDIRTVARLVYHAEMEAVQIAERRES